MVTMDDVDMMEVDDDLDHSKAEKKNPAVPASSSKRTADSLDNPIGPRKKLRGKRTSKRANGRSIIVLDTNILIDHLQDLKTFLSNVHLVESCTLIIPLIVIQELDTLKKKNSSLVANFKFINEQLRAEKFIFSDKVWLKKQPTELMERASSKINLAEMNNDDRVLKSTLLVSEMCKTGDNSVMLVTDDLNLQNKALASGLKSFNWEGFCDKFGIQKTAHPSRTSKTMENFRPSSKRLQTGASSIRGDSEPPGPNKPAESMQFNDWLTLKYSAEKRLKIFMELVLKKEYKDLWDKIFNIDLVNSSLFELIRCIKHGWLGTFGDIFDRKKNVKQTIDSLFDLLRFEKDINALVPMVHSFLRTLETTEANLQSKS